MEQIPRSQRQTQLSTTSHALLLHPDIVQIHERFECKMADMQQQVEAMIQDIYDFLAGEITLVTVKMLAAQQQQQQQQQTKPQTRQLSRQNFPLQTTIETEANVFTSPIPTNPINRMVPILNNHNTTLNSMETIPLPEIAVASRPQIYNATNGDTNSEHNYNNNTNKNNISDDRTSTEQQNQSQIAMQKGTNATMQSEIEIERLSIDSNQRNENDNTWNINYNDNHSKDNSQISDMFNVTIRNDTEQPQQIEMTESFVKDTDLHHRHDGDSGEDQTSIEIIHLCESEDSSAQNDETQLVTSMAIKQHRAAKKRRFFCERQQQQSQIAMQNGITDITQSTVKVGQFNYDVAAKQQTSTIGFERDNKQQRIESTTNFHNNTESVILVKTSNHISAAMVTPKEEPSGYKLEQVPLSISPYIGTTFTKENVEINPDTEIDRNNEMNKDEDDTQIDEYHCIEIADELDNEINKNNKMNSRKNDKKKLRHGIKTISLRCNIDGCEYMADEKQIICHKRETHGLLRYKCRICDPIISFHKSQHLGDHIKLKHWRATDFRCDQCGRTFRTHNAYQKHKYNYHETGLFRCMAPDCAFEHSIRQQVFEHIRLKHRGHAHSQIARMYFPAII